MTSFLSAASYSPVLTLFVGLLTFAGCMGLGAVVLRILRLNVPTPFVQIVSVLLGIEITSLAVQLLAMAQLASMTALISVWGVLVAFAPGTYFVIPRRDKVIFPTRLWPIFAVVFAAAAVNLVAALAPSSKIDELYYHMLLPSRLVADGGLRFYRMPIESAILPHMIYQVFATPLHALRLPDAANVVSWVLSIMLVWLGWMLLQARQVTCTLAYGSVGAVLVGMYPVVNYVAGGAHAFGDLALATAVVAVGTSRQLLETTTPTAFAAVVSLSCCAAASSKLSLWPISAALSLLGTIMAWRAAANWREKLRMPAAVVLPWIIFLLPLTFWTFAHSGSPFGPILAGHFGKTAYDPAVVQEFIRYTAGIHDPMRQLGFEHLVSYSPLLWIGIVSLFASGQNPHRLRLWAAILLIGQLVFILLVLPYQLRFLGGLQYGLLILFAVFVAENFSTRLRPLFSTLLVLGCLLPWLGVQAWYASQFAPVVLRLEDPHAFYSRYIAFFDDYRRLDSLLPKNAVLLAPDFRPPSVYAPRPIFYDSGDLPQNREIFLFGASPARTSDLPQGYTAAQQLYFNPAARWNTFRTPRRPVEIGPLYVTLLQRNPRALQNPAKHVGVSTVSP